MASTLVAAVDRSAPAGAPVGRGQQQSVGSGPATCWIPWAVGGLSVVMASRYVAGGVGYVLDDWFALGNARFGGSWQAAGSDQWRARPGAGLVYSFIFGTLGGHPLPAFLLMAAIGATTGVLLWRLLARHLPIRVATVATVLWVVLPNHTSLEAWISAVNISLALLLVVAGALLLERDDVRATRWASLLFLLATLSYEAVIPVIALLAVATAWIGRGRPDVRPVLTVGVPQVAAAAWIVANWHPAKHDEGWADLGQLPAAHFGWGVFPNGPVANLLLLAALAAVTVALGRLLLRRDGCGPGEYAVLAGLAVIAVGVAPFLRYFYAPLGAGDRFNCVSAVGGALVWAGAIEMLWRVRREAAVIALAAVIGFGLVARWDRARLWTDAASDAVAMQQAVVAAVPAPGREEIVVGPAAVQVDNIAAYLDPSNIEPALRIAYDDPDVRARMSFSPQEFASVPPNRRVDTASVQELGRSCDPLNSLLGACDGRPGR